jgi:hypothetical protein
VLLASRLRLGDRLEVHADALVLSRLARLTLRRLKEGADAAGLCDRGVEDRVLAEFGVDRVGASLSRTWGTSFGRLNSDRDTNGTRAPICIEIARLSPK